VERGPAYSRSLFLFKARAGYDAALSKSGERILSDA
jgi:hypothetical protein